MNQSEKNTDSIGTIIVKTLEENGFFEQLSQKKNILNQWKTKFPIISNSLDSTSDQEGKLTKGSLIILAQNGWYISLSMKPSSTFEHVARIVTGNIEEVDRLMCRWYKKRLLKIRDEIINISPSRSVIIRKAFIAHKKRYYELSIPVLFAQADGICQELTGYQLFKFDKSSRKPLTAKFIEKLKPDSFGITLLEPLRVSLPIANNTKFLLQPLPLNRHAVLHGIDVSYANETNSYKAISLLAYVSSVLSLIRNHDKSNASNFT
ncbi:MAG: hypothetical protein HY964_07505 [Ignavibacteriales bacterium]|nr:hypothetical protein [Ignavibacteriales bacterium]